MTATYWTTLPKGRITDHWTTTVNGRDDVVIISTDLYRHLLRAEREWSERLRQQKAAELAAEHRAHRAAAKPTKSHQRAERAARKQRAGIVQELVDAMRRFAAGRA